MQEKMEDTWRTEELEKSIKGVLQDTTEKKHRQHKRQSKEGRRKDGTREKHRAREKTLDSGHRTGEYDEVKTLSREGTNESLDVELRRKSEIRAKRDESSRKDRGEKSRQEIEKDRQRHERKSKKRESQKVSKHKDTDETRREKKRSDKGEESLRKETFHNQDEVAGDNGMRASHATTPDNSNGYEDDFEEYEDDFEDVSGYGNSEHNEMGNSEVEALRIAMKEENEATVRQNKEIVSTPPKSKGSSKPASARSRKTFINFTAAKQRQMDIKSSQRTMLRGRELMNLIELDVTTSNIFEMPPVKVYELYIKSYGRSNTKQAFVQCHDDIFDRESQTEPIETKDISIQHPTEGYAVKVTSEDRLTNKADVGVTKVNSLRLSAFLERAGQVMNAILEESMSYSSKSHLKSNQRSILFSEGYTRLNADLPFIKGRYVTHAQFHPVQTTLLLTLYSKPKVKTSQGDSSSTYQQDILCVWNVNSSSKPLRVLTCRSKVTSCCFSPIKSTFVFAGTVDGAILVWDLREPSTIHQGLHSVDGVWPLRVPTFSTYGFCRDENHQSSVVKVQPVITSGDSNKMSIPNTALTKESEEMNGLSFQLVSVDEQGVIHFWVVIDMGQTDIAGSETDLGLVPSGKVKLLKSSSIMLEKPSRTMPQALHIKDMQFSLRDPTQFYVATDSGYILHRSRHGDRVSPRCYRRQTDNPVDLIQLDHSPFGLPCFLAASTDGCIYLYSLAVETPLITWSNSTSDMPIISILWSRSRPSVFYVVDVTSKVYVWELLVSQGGPVKTEQFTDGRLITMELSDERTTSGRGLQGRTPAMVITDDKGAVDVHSLNQHFTVSSTDELKQMAEFLNSFR